MKKTNVQYEIVRIQTMCPFGEWFEDRVNDLFTAVYKVDDMNSYVRMPLGSMPYVGSTLFHLIALNTPRFGLYSDKSNSTWMDRIALIGGKHMFGGKNGRARTKTMHDFFEDGATFIPDWNKNLSFNAVLVGFDDNIKQKVTRGNLSPCINKIEYLSDRLYLFNSDNDIATLSHHIGQLWSESSFAISHGEAFFLEANLNNRRRALPVSNVTNARGADFYDPYAEPKIPEKRLWIPKAAMNQASK